MKPLILRSNWPKCNGYIINHSLEIYDQSSYALPVHFPNVYVHRAVAELNLKSNQKCIIKKIAMNLKQMFQVKISNSSTSWWTENKGGNKEIDIASIGTICIHKRIKIFQKYVIRTTEGTRLFQNSQKALLEFTVTKICTICVHFKDTMKRIVTKLRNNLQNACYKFVQNFAIQPRLKYTELSFVLYRHKTWPFT